MHPSASAAFLTLTTPLEGDIATMYVDTHRPPLVTCGIGQMIDDGDEPTDLGYALPWVDKNGRYVREATIRAEFQRIKKAGASARQAVAIATLHLEPEQRIRAFQAKAADNARTLAAAFPNWDAWPADAQLAVVSMAWNLGPAFPPKWPDLSTSLRATKFLEAAGNCLINGKPSVRNRQNAQLFTNAALVATLKLDVRRLIGVDVAIHSAAVVAAAKAPNRPDPDAWFTQHLLAVVNRYKGPLDGKFGPKSAAAWQAYVGSPIITKALLVRLSKDSRLAIPID